MARYRRAGGVRMHHKRSRLPSRIGAVCAAAVVFAVAAPFVAPRFAHSWSENDFENRPLVAYPIPTGRDDLIGSLQVYTIRQGDTLLDVARWYGLSPTEISNANNHMDWWSPPVGKTIIIPTEHILPSTPHAGIVLNIPEMRLYYYYPTPVGGTRRIRKAHFAHTAYSGARHPKAKAHKSGGAHPSIIYTFPVGLGRYDWRTPTGTWTIRDKTYNPTWVVPDDIYQEHLERDGEADHMIEGGDPDNPLGHYRLALTLPMYALHGTNVPWGVGMEVSHGCVRLYPEDIDRLYHHASIGTPGRFVYQPVKYGWRGDSLYVEVHEDLYGVYPGLWRYAIQQAKTQGVLDDIEMIKLEKAVEEKTGVPTFVMPGPEPPSAVPPTTQSASSMPLPPPGSAASAPDADTSAVGGGSTDLKGDSTDNDTDPEGDSEAGDARAAIPPPPRVNAIRPAPAPAADSAATGNFDANSPDSDDGGTAPDKAPRTPDAGDGSEWHRLPTGALPLE